MTANLITLFYIYALGYGFLVFSKTKYTAGLNFSLAGLAGIGLSTILMFLLEIAGLSFSPLNLWIFWFILLSLFLLRDVAQKKYGQWKDYFKPNIARGYFNSVEGTLLAVVILLILVTVVKNLYWPVQSYDSVAGYDLMARTIGIEKTFNVSLHKYDLAGPRGIYPPLVEGIFALFYIMGASSSKIVNTIFFVSLIMLFYQFAKIFMKGIGAAFFTLILTITPEFFAHASLSLTNLPGAAYVTAGLLFLFRWWKERQPGQLMLSGFMLGLNGWTRSDGIIFCIAASLVLFVIVLRKKKFSLWIYHGILSFTPFIAWQIFLKVVIHAESIERFRKHLFWDPALFSYIVNYIKTLLFTTGLYGLIFYIFVIAIIANIKYIRKNWPLLALIAASFVLYTFTYYQLNPETQDSIQTMMRASYKRAMFYFIPSVLFYSAISPMSIKLFDWLEQKCKNFVFGKA